LREREKDERRFICFALMRWEMMRRLCRLCWCRSHYREKEKEWAACFLSIYLVFAEREHLWADYWFSRCRY
jgi:hypothetical protein